MFSHDNSFENDIFSVFVAHPLTFFFFYFLNAKIILHEQFSGVHI